MSYSNVNEIFINYVKDNVEQIKEIYGIKDNGHAFSTWAIGYVNDISDDEAINQTDTLSKGDGGLDGWYFDEEEQIFHLYQVKYSEDPRNITFGSDPVKEILNALDLVKDYTTAVGKSKKLAEVSQKLIDAMTDGASVVLNCIVFGDISEGAREEMKNRCSTNQIKPKYEFWDLKKLYDLYITRETDEDLSNISVSIDLVDNQYIKVDKPYNDNGIGESIVINLGGRQLAKAAKGFTPKIFGSNVRYNLGHQNKVNTKIKETLISETDNCEFWHRNNGITILVNDYKFESNRLILKNPQIVNGCQTVSTMVNNIDDIKDGIVILSKIVKVESNETGKNKALLISESTNSQSPVKSSDLKSNDKVQMAIQTAFRSLREPWYYERKRGEWKTLDKSDRQKCGKRKIGMIELGQTWLSYMGEPSQAISSKELIFSDPELYKFIYQGDQDVRVYLLSKKLFDKFYNLIAINNFNEIHSLTSNIDEQILSKLIRAKKLVVAHCVAMARYILDKRYKNIDGSKAEALVNLLDNDDECTTTLIRIILLQQSKLIKSEGQDIDIRQLYKNKETIKVLFNYIDEYIATIESIGTKLSDVLIEL